LTEQKPVDNSAMTEQITTLQQQMSGFSSQMEALKNENEKLKKESEELKKENETIKKENDELINEIKLTKENTISSNTNPVVSNSSQKEKQTISAITNDSKKTTIDYVNFFLTNHPNDFDPNNIDQYFVAIKWQLQNPISSTEDKILYALKRLFEIKTFEYGQSGYGNYLYESNLKVKNVSNENGKFIVNIEGKIVGIGSMTDMFVKPQITKTIEQYTNNYTIKINNSESEWRCSLDNSGLCQ